MDYTAIIIELFVYEHPHLHRHAEESGTFLQAQHLYIAALQHSHLSWLRLLRREQVRADEPEISRRALQCATEEIRSLLLTEASRQDLATDCFTLDIVKSYLERHSHTG